MSDQEWDILNTEENEDMRIKRRREKSSVGLIIVAMKAKIFKA